MIAYTDESIKAGDLIPSRGKYHLVLSVKETDVIYEGKPKMTFEYDYMWIGPESSDLISIKKALVDVVKKKHQQKISEGYLTSFGFRVDIEPENIVDWSANLQLMQLAGLSLTEVGDYDNHTHIMTVEQYAQMCGEIGIYLKNLRSRKWDNRDAIINSKSQEEACIAAVKWDSLQ